MSAELEQIVALSRALGDPALDLAILGEGNTSLRTGEGTMLVKASGASLVSVTKADFVEMETAPLTALLDDPAADDAAVARAFAPVEERTGRRPSVEAMLHAVCLELGGAHVVGHTHPVPVVALLCSRHAEALATEMLFPDQVVVLGRRPLFVPYVDPGLALARRVRDELETHVARYGEPPKVIYLGNHGLFALGLTPEHVLQITAMAVKASRVLAGALAVGGPSALAEAEADRIDARPDEHYRRAALARARTGGRAMPEPLDGKVAVVTGASTGIGRAVAQELTRRGAAVVIAARSRERVDEAAAALGCTGVVADVTRAEDVAQLIDGTIETHGRIDVLVANAGVYVGGDLWESDPEALDRLLTTNVNGVVRTVRAVLPHLLERGEGDVLVTSSVSGHQAIHWEPVYSASKHALQAFVHTMRRQLIGTGVRIGAIAPGIVLNDLWGVSDPSEIEDKVARGEGIRSEDVADAAAYMLTRPRHVTIRDLVILPREQPI